MKQSINNATPSIREQQQKPFDVTPGLEKWLLEAAETPTTPLIKSDFDEIRKRVRRRHKV